MKQKLPIAEMFLSVQGEGLYTGTLTYFVRLAGCSVGRRPLCWNFDGKQFCCDTDYRVSYWLTPRQIAKKVRSYSHVCITGGEPLMHDLGELIELLRRDRKSIHLETSGTVELPKWHNLVWLTVSPKKGWLHKVVEAASEVKVLVGPDTSACEVEKVFVATLTPWRYLQPIDGEERAASLRHALILQRKLRIYDPKLSLQVHKWIGAR